MPESNAPKKAKWPILAILLLVILIGAFLRFYQIDTLPPGLFIDEAMNGFDAQDVWRNRHFPIFFSANNGREPLYIYLQAVMMALVGESALSLRLVSAYVGILTIPLVYVLGKTIFQNVTRTAVFIGVSAAAALAASYWHLSLSRLGFRTILLPLFVMLVLLWFWWGWQRGKMYWFVFVGVALGLSQYTYLAARALPLLVIGFIGVILLAGMIFKDTSRSSTKLLLKGLMVIGIITLLVYLPLGYYLLSTPSDVSARTEDVSLIGEATTNGESVVLALVKNMLLVGRMFVDQGDMNLRHNLPDRAALDWLNLIGFVTGLLLIFRHWRKPQVWLLAIWLVVMLLPTLLATAAPQYLRASGAIGAVMLIVGGGLVWWWQQLLGWMTKRGWVKRPFYFYLLLPLLILTISTVHTAYDYFVRWANIPNLYDYFEGVELEAAMAAKQKLQEGPVYLVPEIPAQRSPVMQLFLNYSDVRPLPSGCLVFQPQTQELVTYLVRTHRDEAALTKIQQFWPGGVVETAVFQPDSGEILFESYTVYPEENVTVIPETVVAQFGDAIQLTYSDVRLENDAVHINANWQAVQKPMADHTIFFHLYAEDDVSGQPVAQLDVQPCYLTSSWQPGEALQETYTLPLPPDLPLGQYALVLGWYTWPSFERLPLEADTNVLPDQRFSLGQITIDD